MVTIRSQGPALSPGDIARLEGVIRCELPPDYREFLLATNGGDPVPDTIDISGFAESPTDVQVFFGVTRAIESNCIEWNRDVLVERLDVCSLPKAGDSIGNVFCISLCARDKGQISYLDLDAVFCDYGVKPPRYVVAESFGEFMTRLRNS